MQKLSNVELHFIVNELQCLVKSRFLKLYFVGEREYRFKFKKNGLEYSVQVNMPQGLYLSKYAKDSSENDFVKALRKRINNWIVDRVFQYNSDKVVIIELGKYKLYLDFIGKGNIALETNSVIDLIEIKDEKRNLVKGQVYSLPENKKLDFIDFEKAENVFDLNLSKKFQEKLATEKNWKQILREFLKNPSINIEKEVVIVSFEGKSTFNSLSEALDSVNKPEITQKKNPAYLKMKKRLEEQQQALTRGLERVEKLKEQAEFLNSRKWLIQEKIKNKDYKENDKELIIEID